MIRTKNKKKENKKKKKKKNVNLEVFIYYYFDNLVVWNQSAKLTQTISWTEVYKQDISFKTDT